MLGNRFLMLLVLNRFSRTEFVFIKKLSIKFIIGSHKYVDARH